MDLINKLKRLKKPKAPWSKYYDKDEKTIVTPNKSIYTYFEEHANSFPNEIAYDYFGTTRTFRQFLNDIDKCARAFRCQGIREGDVVTVCMPNTPEGITCFYALSKIGAIANMVHPLSGEQEIRHYLTTNKSVMLVMIDMCYEKVKNIINETNVYKTVVVSAKDSMPFLMGIGYTITKGFKIKKPKSSQEYIYWKDFINKGKNYNGRYCFETPKDHPAVILHSGGTTGNPKSIVLSNGAFTSLVEQAKIVFKNIRPGDAVLTILPIFHGFGLGVTVYATQCLGVKQVLIPQFDAGSWGKLINKHKPAIILGVPTLYENMMKYDCDMSFVKHIISGGDTINLPLEQKINVYLREHGCRVNIAQGYGMTEALAATCVAWGDANKTGSIGIPLPGNYYKVVRPGTHEEVEVGEDGELCTTGPTLMLGYLDNEKETNEMLQMHKDGYIWLHTGDIGYMDKDGCFFYRQRLKRMIVSSGYNVYPQQIETVIEEHEDVLKCTVIGIPHPYKVEVPKAYIVLKSGVKPSFGLKSEIKELCKKNLAKFSVPHDYEFRESLPKTKIGKVDFRELAREEMERQAKEKK